MTYQCEALSGLYIKEVGQHALRKGTFELVGFEGEDLIRKRFRFDGQITPKEHGENSIENFNEFSFEITATGDVEVIILS